MCVVCTLSCYKVLTLGLKKYKVINLCFLLFKIIFLKLMTSLKSTFSYVPIFSNLTFGTYKFLEKGVRLITNNRDTVN